MDFVEMMTLEPHGPDTFVATGPSYPWGGLYGGQIVAQCLRAAGLTVDRAFRVHSLHAYFIRRGDAAEPIRLEVDRIRNGRSFTTRRVVARQATGAILNMSASFHLDEDAPEVQTALMPAVPRPEAVPENGWSELLDRRWVPVEGPGRTSAWLRVRGPLGDDPRLHACALAYLSDDLPTDAVVNLHPERDPDPDLVHEGFMSASLDHALWFHRPVRADEWTLHDLTSHGLMSARGVAIGHVFTEDGTHVATVAQEVLLRRVRGR